MLYIVLTSSYDHFPPCICGFKSLIYVENSQLYSLWVLLLFHSFQSLIIVINTMLPCVVSFYHYNCPFFIYKSTEILRKTLINLIGVIYLVNPTVLLRVNILNQRIQCLSSQLPLLIAKRQTKKMERNSVVILSTCVVYGLQLNTIIV